MLPGSIIVPLSIPYMFVFHSALRVDGAKKFSKKDSLLTYKQFLIQRNWYISHWPNDHPVFTQIKKKQYRLLDPQTSG